ncbi:MAG: SIR2 family protein [Bacteroidetes bacterium]|nr:SIR2 family protein [Bacteroidota bacterium]
MSKKFFTDIKNIRNAIDTNKLVVFAGAGISVDAGIPNWGTLIDEMKSEIAIPPNEADYLRIAQMYYNERQQKEYIDKVRAVLKHKKVKYNEIHEWVFKLNPEHILTTNYDDLLEQVIKKESLPFSVVSKDKEFPYALNTNLLVKVHGDLNDTDIVLKEDDYLDYSLNHPLIEAFLKSVFASKVVLFVGYGFSDINLKMIVQTVRNILGKDFQNAYLLSVDENIHPTQREYFKNKGINVLNYFDAKIGGDTNYITDYLKGHNALNQVHFVKGENLSEKGQHLLDFLVFISTYDKFNEALTEKNVIDQIHLSLSRFSEFKSLTPEFVANLYPFNASKQYAHDYESYSLVLTNRNLYDLFFNQIEYVDDEVKFKPPQDLNLSAEEIKEFERKLKEIILALNFSLIFHIFKQNDTPDSFGNYGWAETSKRLKVKTLPKCNCFNCRLNRFEFSSVIADTLILTVNETTSIQSDLELAYANYKIGNFSQSFRLFEELANKAWQAGKYFSYYIAKHNIKTLRNLINFFERTLNEEEKKRIVRKLDNIDFDKLISQIPYMGEKEYELLKMIRDDDVLHKAEKEINEIYDKILNVYDGYKTGTRWTSGPFYPQAIEIELYKIISFYTNNYIVADEFSNFSRVCKKGVEALLISFATKDDYKEKIKEFNKLFFDVVVFYCTAEEVKAITQKYEINKIVFNETSLPLILEMVNNFLKSFFEENKFFGRTTHADKLTRNQTSSEFFEDKCRKKFNNIFLLLSGMNLTKENAPDLIQNLLDFIKHETFLHRKEIEFICAFMYKHYQLFTKENLESLLKSILAKLSFYNDGALLRTIAFIFKENNFDRVSDRELIFTILSLTKHSDRKTDTLIYLWAISDDAIREELKNKITEKLNQKFNSELYTNAAFKNIIDFNKYFEQFILEINNTKGNGAYTLSSGRPKMQSFVFINAMIFIYNMNVKSDDKRLEAFTNLADYMKFYLNPEKFDYANFKIEWLDIVGEREVFYKRFAKIPALKKEIEKALKEKFDAELAELYAKYFIK